MEDKTGMVFGALTVIKRNGSDKAGNSLWECRCQCGAITAVRGFSFKKIKSCGCANVGRTLHGAHKTAEYKAWQHMKERCSNQNNKRYGRYGGRGLTYPVEWGSFEAFFADMGPRPTKKHSLERVNNDLGYSKENCIWADRHTQDNNTSRCIHVTAFGETKTVAQWAKQHGLHHETLRSRLVRYGWDAERAITTPGR
jgi:hypothetical protein